MIEEETTMVKRSFLVALLLALGLCTSWAQYGKIIGFVLDKERQEPLVGANVVVLGTSLGAVSGVDGRFVIFNIPPGRWDLRARYIGYQDQIIKELEIVAGLTQEIKFDLMASSVELQAVEVTAERPLIQKSATNAIRITTDEDIRVLPIRTIEQIVALNPGVVLQNGTIYIRGSRASEAGYTVEGANSVNIMSTTGGPIITPITEALQEITVQAGGYTAEYGGANGGLIQQNLKSGGEEIHASLQLETDNFTDPGHKFLNTYSYGYSMIVGTFSGPIIPGLARLFIAGNNIFTRDYSPTFWSGSPTNWSDGARVDTVYDSGTWGGRVGDPQLLYWDPGNIPGRQRNRYGVNGTLLLDFKPFYVKIGGIYTWAEAVLNDDPLYTLFDQARLTHQKRTEAFLNTKLTYNLAPNAFIEANWNYADNRSKTYDPVFGDNLLQYGDSLQAALHGWTNYAYAQPPNDYTFYGFRFARPGGALTNYQKDQSAYMGGSLSLSWQLQKHELKVGGTAEYWTVRNYELGAAWILAGIRQDPDNARDENLFSSMVRRLWAPNMYGFDALGRILNEGPDGPKHPRFFSAYVQDKLELEDLILNLGLRWDYINVDSWFYTDPLRPTYDLTAMTIPDLTSYKPWQFVSPRLGFSFPVTDRTVFHVQYGSFVQTPPLWLTYRGLPLAASATSSEGRGVSILQPTRTLQYEAGFTQQLADAASLDITAFYKDIKDESQFTRVKTVSGWSPRSYNTYTPADFATTKGVEVRLTLRRTHRVQAQLNYTFADARGTNAAPFDAVGALMATGVRPTVTNPLTFDQAHRGSVLLDYRFGRNDGGPLLERLGVNLLFTFNSGHRYTEAELLGNVAWSPEYGNLPEVNTSSRRPLESINGSTTPWVFNLDMRIDKTVSFLGMDLNVYAYVQNVLNTKNVINVYSTTGNAYNDSWLASPASEQVIAALGPRYVDLYRTINLENGRHYNTYAGYQLFGPPRQIRFGLSAEI
jgi:hypothetical protein